MEQRRLLIFVLISVVVIVAYTEALRRIYGRPQVASEQNRPPEVQRSVPPTEASPQPSSGLAVPASDEAAVVVDTDMLHVAITPVGARLAAVQLKGYRRSVTADSDLLDLVQPGPILPATLQIGPQTSDADLSYRPDRTELLLRGGEHGEITFSADSASGLRIEKHYRFNGEGYLFDVSVAITGEHGPSSVGLVMTPLAAEMPSARAAPTAVALSNRRLVEKHLPDILKQPASVESSAWAGFAEQYFMTVAVTPEGTLPAVFTASDGTPIVRLDAGLVDGTVNGLGRAVVAPVQMVAGAAEPGCGGPARHDRRRARGDGECRDEHSDQRRPHRPRVMRVIKFRDGLKLANAVGQTLSGIFAGTPPIDWISQQRESAKTAADQYNGLQRRGIIRAGRI